MSELDNLKVALKLRLDPTWFIEEVVGVEMFPKQREIMQTFYKHNYRDLVLACGMRAGKSALAAMFAVVEFAQLLTLPDPQSHFHLLRSQPIAISVVSTSESQALDSVFSNARTMIEDTDWFSTFNLSIRDLIVRDKSKNILLKTLSSWSTTAIGRSNKTVILDEVSNFERTAGRRGAWQVYTKLRKSTDTFKDAGHTISISSPTDPNDIIMTLYKRNDPKTLRYLLPTWEMNPNYTEEELRQEHRFDLAAFYRDYACQPASVSGQMFPEPLHFVRTTNVLEQSNPDVSALRILAIDPAIRNDSFGVATGYISPENKIVVDGVTRFTREHDAPYISPSMVREFLEEKIRTHNIVAIIFDTWMYPELIEHLDAMGVTPIQHIVRKEDYDRWKELDAAGEVEVVWDEVLQHETENLYIVSERKVDHPPQGSKDVADCVANVIWFLATQPMPVTEVAVCQAF